MQITAELPAPFCDTRHNGVVGAAGPCGTKAAEQDWAAA